MKVGGGEATTVENTGGGAANTGGYETMSGAGVTG